MIPTFGKKSLVKICKMDEAFCFTDVRFLRDCKIEVPQPLDMAVHLDRDWSVDEAYKLVIIDGQLSPSLSNTTGLPDGVFVGSVSALPDTFAFPSLASMEGDLFSFLNGIGTPDLGVIIVPDGCKLDRPLHLLYYSQQGGDDAQSVCVSSPRLVVLLGKGAEMDIIEEFGGSASKSYWTNSVLDVSIGEHAKLCHTFIQAQPQHAIHVKWTFVQQLTDAGQLSRSLLLAPRATVNVKPNLQIVADDVKCSHGAAVSDLEDDQIFYFQARGVDVQTARNALVFSFGADVIERLPYKDLRKRVECDVKGLLAAEGAFH